MAEQAYLPGTRVTVRIRGQVIGPEGNGPDQTTEVEETGASRWTHFLYLASPRVTRTPEGTVTAEFTGTVGPGEGKYGTCLVREGGFTHYLFLSSDEITKGATTVELDNTEEYLTAGQVRERISELEEGLDSWEVKRVRDNTVIARRPTAEAARKYIDDEDYDQERVVAVYNPDGLVVPAELRALRALQEAAEISIPSWGDGATEIVRWSVINDEYARDLFKSTAGPVADDWPYCFIDWDEAASAVRERRYSVQFGGVTYYQAVD